MSETPQDVAWPPAPTQQQVPESFSVNRREFWFGIACVVFGIGGMLFSCFLGWAFATGEAGREMYHDGHTPPMTAGDVAGLAVFLALVMPPFGLIWGLPTCICGAIKVRRSLSSKPSQPAV